MIVVRYTDISVLRQMKKNRFIDYTACTYSVVVKALTGYMPFHFYGCQLSGFVSTYVWE